MIGKTLGRIEILRMLGRGGAGEVYEGYDTTLERKVAIKRLAGHRWLDDGSKQRFLQEAQLLSLLDHPNICKIYDYRESDGDAFLVLELIEGENLRTVMKGDLAFKEKLDIALQISLVLQAAHAEGIVHRDLKPANVMIDDDKTATVLDFGIAHTMGGVTEIPTGHTDVSDSQPLVTTAGTVVGTPMFMSPEQASGEPVTPASDIYSFGLLLQELFTGTPAFTPGRPARTLMIDVVMGRRNPIGKLNKHLRSLLEDMLEMEPGERPTATQVFNRLRWIREKGRRRLRRAAGLVATLCVAAGVAKYTIDLRREQLAAIEARAQTEELISFMLDDLARELRPQGRLLTLQKVSEQVLEHYQSEDTQQSDETIFNRAKALGLSAEVTAAQGEFDLAIENARIATALLRELVRSNPDTPRFRAALSSALLREVRILSRSGDAAAARATNSEALEISRSLMKQDPDRARWRELVADSLYAKGLDQLFNQAQPDPGSFLEAASIYEGLHDSHPAELRYVYRMAVLYGQGLGQVHSSRGDTDAALRAITRALELYQQLVAADPSNVFWKFGYAWEHRRLGYQLISVGRYDEALRSLSASKRISVQLQELEATNVDWKHTLALDDFLIGRVYRRTGRFEQAKETLEHAASIHEDLIADQPDNENHRSSLAEDYFELALLYRDAQQREKCKNYLERTLDVLAPVTREKDIATAPPFVLDLKARAAIMLGHKAMVEPLIERLLGMGWTATTNGAELRKLLEQER